jgi:DNA-binding transcriptional regulator YhcF (GntR family)
LEREGVVTPKRGRGMEVAADAQAACRNKRKELVRGRIRESLQEAAASALSPDDIRRIVEEELAAVNGKRPSKEKH